MRQRSWHFAPLQKMAEYLLRQNKNDGKLKWSPVIFCF